MADATTNALTEAETTLKAASGLPAEDRNAKRARKLKVELAMLDLDKAAVEARAARDEEAATYKRNITERVARAKREAKAAIK